MRERERERERKREREKERERVRDGFITEVKVIKIHNGTFFVDFCLFQRKY